MKKVREKRSNAHLRVTVTLSCYLPGQWKYINTVWWKCMVHAILHEMCHAGNQTRNYL